MLVTAYRAVHSEGEVGLREEEAGACVGAEQEPRRMAGGAPSHPEHTGVGAVRAHVGFAAGEAEGGDRVGGEVFDRAVQGGEDLGGAFGGVVVEKGEKHVAGLCHRGGRLEVVADDVADDRGDYATRQPDGVVPVAADVPGSDGWTVDGSAQQGAEIGQSGQQHALERLRVHLRLPHQSGIVDRESRGFGERRDHGLVMGAERPPVLPVAEVQVAGRTARAARH